MDVTDEDPCGWRRRDGRVLRMRLASSLYRDVNDGAGTEVEQILGDLVARARGFGVPTPLLDLATLHLRGYERRRR
jgi:ketopantoate reductase